MIYSYEAFFIIMFHADIYLTPHAVIIPLIMETKKTKSFI